jgi:hypothetical protein
MTDGRWMGQGRNIQRGLPCQNTLISAGRSEALKQRKIKQVDGGRLVAAMEEQLLIAGQGRHAYTAKLTLVERPWRIVELPAADVGLAAVPGRIENHRVNVDPTRPSATSSTRTGRQSVSMRS